jgi:Zn ribbon nucleic-acid-binding protein
MHPTMAAGDAAAMLTAEECNGTTRADGIWPDKNEVGNCVACTHEPRQTQKELVVENIQD